MFSLRSALRPGDIGHLVAAHGRIYARDYGWNEQFEGYVAAGLAHFVADFDPVRDRIWLAEDAATRLCGSVAIVHHESASQLRWFLVDPAVRGRGLGRRLIDEAVAFWRAGPTDHVFLWTVSALDAAARHYRRAGFSLTESITTARWGTTVTEQRYVLSR